MANNLFISYDLITPGQNYDAVIGAIKSLGSWAHVHKSLWYVNSALDHEAVAKMIRAKMDQNDSLMVINASTNNFYCFNVKDEVLKYMQQQWYL
ncbi:MULTISPECIES: hypothetical protein [Aeromonas]|uniref:CRISPR-associated protein Cas2 n=1 Tax=Aeromonas media TaxID=651 RepID=A0AAW5REA1_AERME|nr:MULTISPECIES: hypothetical protein [Aeromonas]AXB01416.1 hypothetical protein C1C92_10890 [Aeromonas caviae]MBL0496217.1 hypothetical protein [Aeromonas caviae]MBS4641489.1 hypothetical protein [Aeromonas media]MCV3287055.1 hypothetical protein [Aeromonas media]MDU7580116.1 hypothetical protein [Aeromonas sp.]